ncbi:MAG: periplasmic heavy metal sensor [Alphaproteobacteria bacterium]|nr:periplasmic heavy metal sensor [Alphaproteobacteria bacterium]
MSKPTKIIFTFSLILNILFLGVFFGQFHHIAKEKKPWKETKAALAPETRDVMKAMFREKGKDVFPLFRQAGQEKKAMKAVIVAKEFDGNSYDMIADEFEDLNDKLMKHRLTMIKAILSQLPQSERVKIVDHTVERMLGSPRSIRNGKKDAVRFRHHVHQGDIGAQDETMKQNHGAIQPVSGQPPFEARSIGESNAKQAE